MQRVMFGEFGSVIEADCFAHCLGKLTELLGDGLDREGGLSIERMIDQAEAGVSFVEDEQALAISGKQHEVGFPMARRIAAFNIGRSVR